MDEARRLRKDCLDLSRRVFSGDLSITAFVNLVSEVCVKMAALCSIVEIIDNRLDDLERRQP
jgi:hypothetical protein